MSFYSDLAADAHSLISEFGSAVTLTRVTPGGYDADTGITTGETTTNYTGYGVKFEYAANMIDGSRILQGDQRCYLSTVGIVNPAPSDTMTINSVVYRVVESRPLQPALVSVLFDCQLRGVL